MSKDSCEISGIKCNVINCIHHASDDRCEAGCIEVGPSCSCTCSNETSCNTFKAKEL